MEEAAAWRVEQLSKHGHEPGYAEAIEIQYRRYIHKLGVKPRSKGGVARVASHAGVQTQLPHRQYARPTAPSTTAPRKPTQTVHVSPKSSIPLPKSASTSIRGGGGSFGGAGANGSWEAPDHAATRTSEGKTAQTPPIASKLTPAKPQYRVIKRNGYTYKLDDKGRTLSVSGTLSDTDKPKRSRNNQAQAGGLYRRATDDGGHYIAARFNGPTDAYNHFAQDAKFNRGRYRVLEDQWSREKLAGRIVTVAIVPHYHKGSIRPFEIDVSFTVNGRLNSIKFPNEATEKKYAK
jgi:hypothetical protein